MTRLRPLPARRAEPGKQQIRQKGALAQENIGFGLTILPPSAFKKPGNPSGLPGFFHATIHPKLPGQNCFALLKQKLGLQSKEKRRRHPLWLSRRFDDAMRPNFCFRGNVFLRQRAFSAVLFGGKGPCLWREKRGTGRGWGFFLQALNACFLQHAGCGRFEKGRFFFATGQGAFGALRPGRGQPRGKPHGKEAWA